MATIDEIIQYVEVLSGHKLNADEGVHFGTKNKDVRTAVVCWMATKGAIEFAYKIGADLLIAHESLYFPYDAVIRDDNPEGWEDWPVNKQRRTLLEEYNLTFLRIHESADEICIFDAFRRQLNLPKAGVVGDRYNYKRFDIELCTVSELVEHVKRAVGMSHLRFSAPKGLCQKVSKVGLLWGGVGLFVNVRNQAKLLELGCDVFIAGETDDYGFRFARDQEVPLIETSHEVSENRGIKEFQGILSAKFPQVQFEFYENQCPWRESLNLSDIDC